MSIVRHSILALVASVVALAALAASAEAARIVTWEAPSISQSRFVDPTAAPDGHYNEPPGVAERPNALKADVYLPDGYGKHPDRRYPVLYLLHGHGDAYDSWPNPANGDLLETAKGFPGIIVMLEGDHGWYTNWWNGGERGSPAWERYHLDQVIAATERRWRIREGRRWHAIAGLSMGGEGAIFYASQRPGYFGSAASFSGVLSIQRPEYQQAFKAANGEDPREIYGDPEAQEFYWRGHNPTALIDNLANTRLYVSVGDGVPDPLQPNEVQNQFGQIAEAELHQQAGDFVAAAGAAGIPVTYDEHGGIHDWRYWRADLANAIRWGFFRKPPRDRHEWSYSTVAQKSEAWAFRLRFRKPPAEVETISRHGRRLSGVGSGRVRIRTPRGCKLSLRLPFEVELPQRAAC